MRVVLALLSVFFLSANISAQTTSEVRYIVQFKNSGAQSLDVQSLGEAGVTAMVGVKPQKILRKDNSAVFKSSDIAALKSSGAVASIEEDKIYHAFATPNDSAYSQNLMYGLSGTYGISASSAWDISTGSQSVMVGIVDTGIDYNHPDLQANVWTNPNEIAGNGLDDDGNGFVDDVHGYNFNDSSDDPMDDNGHGTHVSGTIGAAGNNGTGVVGVNWNVTLVGMKCLGADGSGYLSSIAEAIDYAVVLKDQGFNIRVLNMSLGGGNSDTLKRAIQRAETRGILVAAAAGNESNDNDSNPSYPASYNLDNIISVAATDDNGELAYFSNYGETSVDLAAPGVDIVSTYPTALSGSTPYEYLSGTSMATPHVAGVAALVAAVKPEISMSQLRSAILVGATPLASVRGYTVTGALLNAAGAIAVAQGSASSVQITGRVLNPKGKGIKGVKINLISDGVAVQRATTDSQGSFAFSYLSAGTYSVTAKRLGVTIKPRKKILTISSDTTQNFVGRIQSR